MIRDQFDVLYQEGATVPRVLPIVLHTFIVGQPFRMKHFSDALAYIGSHKDVWLTTASELNGWYRQQNTQITG